MLTLLAGLLAFAAFLFCWSSGGSLTKREWVVLYLGATLMTLTSQIYARLLDCDGLGGCGLSFAKAIVWSIIWPISWLRWLVGL